MPKTKTTDFAIEYGLIAALVSIAAVAAADASYFAVAGLCFLGSLACCRRLGRLVELRLDSGAGSRG